MWPFRRKSKWVPRPGDRVRFKFVDDKPIGLGMVMCDSRVDIGEVAQATVDGEHVLVRCKDPAPYRKGWWRYWVPRRDVQLLQPETRSSIDLRILGEVVALEKAVGDTDTLVELLRSVREPYEVGRKGT